MRALALDPDPARRIAPLSSAGEQDSLPSRYRWPVQLASLAAFALAFLGWLNETWLFLFDNPIWLNRYTEYALILGFGIWRIRAENNAYTRRRLAILVAVVTGFWWLIPWLAPFFEPHVGYLWSQPVFPSLHVPGTLTFFLTLGLVFLFGRRAICGFGCPCVGIRETVGFPFRDRTTHARWAWRLRHVKWLFFVWYAGVLVATQYPPNSWTLSLVGGFWLVIALTYFGTFFLSPLVGNRFYCRTLCPFGATFGLLNHAGFYDLKMDPARCIDCGRCEQACDMGIPVWRQGKAHGQVMALEECMGCARCVVSCPTDALELRDVRNLFRPALRQDASHLLRRTPVKASPAEAADPSHGSRLSLPAIQAEASRCLDCGVPGCRQGCPLHNRIPEWLALAARGRWHAAAELAHATNPLPELCGALCPQDRLCEGACARSRQGGRAVAIGAVERALVEEALERGWRPRAAPARRAGRSAAVIGAGPAGLAFADAMSRAGWDVEVIDRAPNAGGLLASALPPFRLDKRALERRREFLAQAGVRFALNVEVDAARFAALLEGHDAVFLGLGAARSKDVELPGRDRAGVAEAIEFLAGLNGQGPPAGVAGKPVLVLGGGDTALDCARAAARAGAGCVTVAYRGPSERLRASGRERSAAERDGVRFLFGHVPLAIEGDGAVRGVRFGVGAGEETVPCALVILAFGQRPGAPVWLARFGVAADDGTVRIDAHGRSTHPRVFAGGDCTHGPDLVVTAAAAGRRAAKTVLAQERLRRWHEWRAAPRALSGRRRAA